MVESAGLIKSSMAAIYSNLSNKNTSINFIVSTPFYVKKTTINNLKSLVLKYLLECLNTCLYKNSAGSYLKLQDSYQFLTKITGLTVFLRLRKLGLHKFEKYVKYMHARDPNTRPFMRAAI